MLAGTTIELRCAKRLVQDPANRSRWEAQDGGDMLGCRSASRTGGTWIRFGALVRPWRGQATRYGPESPLPFPERRHVPPGAPLGPVHRQIAERRAVPVPGVPVALARPPAPDLIAASPGSGGRQSKAPASAEGDEALSSCRTSKGRRTRDAVTQRQHKVRPLGGHSAYAVAYPRGHPTCRTARFATA